MKSFTDNNDDFRRPLNLPKILDGKFYNNIQSHPKTPGGIQATCTTCFGKISGTTKSTGNFLSHIKRRHKEILPSCQLYCSAKNLSCFNQTDIKFPGNFPMTLTNSNVPIMLAYPTSTPVTVTKEHKPQVSCVTTTAMVMSVAPTTTNPNVIPAVSTYLRSDSSPSSQTTANNVVTINNPTNGVFKQSPPFHL